MALQTAVRAYAPSDVDAIAEHDRLLDRIATLVFADTIVLAQPLTPTSNPALFLHELVPFFAMVSLTCRRFFEAGLPLRGAISLGGFVIRESCFAGEAVLQALKLERRLEFSGCALEDKTGRAIVGAVKMMSPEWDVSIGSRYRRLLFFTDAPTKTGVEWMALVRWGDPFTEWGYFPDSPPDFCERAFRAHSKQLDKRAADKLAHTIALLETSRLFPQGETPATLSETPAPSA
ncbi:MAG: hypothetical protein C0497_12255 [Gemmatimonas sp.]|nr:hypothetical protein [Gemmatimonas sp.]